MERYKVRSRWCKMLSRCEDDDNPQYCDYGARGIYVCREWREFEGFYQWVIENGIESTKQLDRTNNDGPYEPNNCRYVTRSENGRNKRNNVFLTAFGETKLMIEWSEDDRCKVRYKTLLVRNLRGWDSEKAISAPSNSTRKDKVPHNAKTIYAFGEEKIFSEWLKDTRCKAPYQTIWARLGRGWSTEKAISTPPR